MALLNKVGIEDTGQPRKDQLSNCKYPGHFGKKDTFNDMNE